MCETRDQTIPAQKELESTTFEPAHSYRPTGSIAACPSRNSSKDSLGICNCSPFLEAASAVPPAAPARTPIAAPVPPPAIPPMSAPNPAPPSILPAVFLPSPLPLSSNVSVSKGYAVPLMTMSVNSSVSWELPDILPADDACASRPWTMLPLGATTTSSACKLVSRLAVNRYPVLSLFESTESIIRIRIRVPAGTVTLLWLCAGLPAVAG